MEFSTIGYLSTFFLALCGGLEAFRSFQTKKSSIGLGMLWTWLIGEVFGLAYVSHLGDLPLILNYSLNIAFICVILRYRLFPEEDL